MSKKLFFAIIVIALIFLAACDNKDDDQKSPTNVPASPENTASGAIVLADIGDDPDKIINGMQPIADYLAARLGDFDIGRGEVRVAPDLETLVAWIEAGEVDLYFDSPYPILIAQNEGGAVPILRRAKYQVWEYHSVFFAFESQGFDSVEDLRGQIVAMDKEYSSSGYLMPVAYLIQNGYTVVQKADPTETVAADEVGYAFSGEDDNTVQWVISGRAVAGVVDNSYFARLPDETREQFEILGETGDVPRQMAAVAGDLDPVLVEAIKGVLLGMKDNEEGRQTLLTWEDSGFDEFPEGLEAALSDMQALYTIVQGH